MKDDAKSARLTAYVLGELDQAQRAVLEEELRASPSMSEEVEKIRQTALLLREELAKEPRLYLSQQQRSEIEKAIGEKASGWFSSRWFVVAGGLAAACLVMAVLLTPLLKHSDGLMQAGPQLAQHESKVNFSSKPKSPDLSTSSQVAADRPHLHRSSEAHGISARKAAGRPQDKSNAAFTTFDRKEKADAISATASAKRPADTVGYETMKQVAAAPMPPPKQPSAQEEDAASKAKFASAAVGSLTSARLKSEESQSRAAGVSGGVRPANAGEPRRAGYNEERKSVAPASAKSRLDQLVQENFISGAVTDAGSQSLSGAKITIVDLKTGVSAHTTSGDKGQFQIPSLAAGNFHIEVELVGFKKFSQDVVLHPGEKLQITVKLLPEEQK